MNEIHILFDGPPGPECGRFVETETPEGVSISAGRWEQRGEYWHLILPTCECGRAYYLGKKEGV